MKSKKLIRRVITVITIIAIIIVQSSIAVQARAGSHSHSSSHHRDVYKRQMLILIHLIRCQIWLGKVE